MPSATAIAVVIVTPVAVVVIPAAVIPVVVAIVAAAVEQVTTDNGGTKPGPKEMGLVMKATQQKIAASGVRADGKLVSELVKSELAKS